MKRLAIIVASVALLVIAANAVFQEWQKIQSAERTFRLRATATILVDGVERTGSAVQEFRLVWNYQPQLGNNGAWRLTARGEAVKIDVPGGDSLYALISADVVFYNCAVRGSQELVKLSLLEISRCEVRELFPTTIALSDSPDRPQAIAARVGDKDYNGYRFVRMFFERTDEPMTNGRIPDHLWRNLRMVLRVTYDKYTQVLGSSNFKTGKFH